MRTAEEYLEEKFAIADKLDWFKPIVECLNIARKETAISILEWSAKRGWESYVDEDRWICPSDSYAVITTEQLYEKFEEDKNK